MNKYIFIGLVFFGTMLQSLNMFAQTPQQPYLPTQSNPISKNYFFTTLCIQDSIVSKILREDSVIRHWNIIRISAMKDAAISCNNDAICIVKKMLISDEEIVSAKVIVQRTNVKFRILLHNDLKYEKKYLLLILF
jgi:hypothetical protein